MSQKLRFVTGVTSVLLVLGCLWVISARYGEWADQVATERETRSEIDAYLERFSLLKQELHGLDVVGYVTLPSAAPSQFSDLEFFLTQYAVAPVIVQASTDYRYVIGNFRSAQGLDDYTRSTRMKVVRDFRNGIVLFENEEPG